MLVEIKLLLLEINGDDRHAALTENKDKRWKAWISPPHNFKNLKIPCYLKPFDMNGKFIYELHHFSDASGEAYGVVSYFRIANELGRMHCLFLMRKSHLVPAPMTTMPCWRLSSHCVSIKC